MIVFAFYVWSFDGALERLFIVYVHVCVLTISLLDYLGHQVNYGKKGENHISLYG